MLGIHVVLLEKIEQYVEKGRPAIFRQITDPIFIVADFPVYAFLMLRPKFVVLEKTEANNIICPISNKIK